MEYPVFEEMDIHDTDVRKIARWKNACAFADRSIADGQLSIKSESAIDYFFRQSQGDSIS